MSYFLQDGFTGVNGTLITAHLPEFGASYGRFYTGGPDLNYEIQSNRIRRNDWAGDVADAWVWNAAVSPTADYSVEVDVVLASLSAYAELMLFARGDGAEAICSYLYIAPGGSADCGLNMVTYGAHNASLSTTVDVSDGVHKMRLDVKGAVASLWWDGVKLLERSTWTVTPPIVRGTAGFSMKVNGAFSEVSLDNLVAGVWDTDGPHFWLECVRTTETG